MKWVSSTTDSGLRHDLQYRLGSSSHTLTITRVDGKWSLLVDDHFIAQIPEHIQGSKARRSFAYDALCLRARQYQSLLDRLVKESKDLRR